jgi:glutaryl-CoA dehydrogenase
MIRVISRMAAFAKYDHKDPLGMLSLLSE